MNTFAVGFVCGLVASPLVFWALIIMVMVLRRN